MNDELVSKAEQLDLKNRRWYGRCDADDGTQKKPIDDKRNYKSKNEAEKENNTSSSQRKIFDDWPEGDRGPQNLLNDSRTSLFRNCNFKSY